MTCLYFRGCLQVGGGQCLLAVAGLYQLVAPAFDQFAHHLADQGGIVHQEDALAPPLGRRLLGGFFAVVLLGGAQLN